MTPTSPPFLPHHVRLVGHRDLGTVPARWDGCLLRLESGTVYGPCAVFSAEPVAAEAKASRGALVWHNAGGIWNLCQPHAISLAEAPYTAACQWAHSYLRLGAPMKRKKQCPSSAAAIAQITTWAREDGYEVPPWPGEARAEPATAPQPVGTWGGHTDWIAWGGGECPVERDVQVVLRDGTVSVARPGKHWVWKHYGRASRSEIIAYRVVQAAPKDRTVYDPADIQAGDCHHMRDGTAGIVLGTWDGWIVYSDRIPHLVGDGRFVIRVDPVDINTDDDIPF